MQPASTLKLLTSVVALDQIGPNVRGFTELLTRAQEVEVLRASTIGNVRIVDEAVSAAQPIAPSRLPVKARR